MSVQHTQLGRYEIVGSLARGRMAELFLARLHEAEGVEHQVVIKRVLPELAGDRAVVDRFIAEARIAAALDHQNIVRVHDVGDDAAAQFFAMEQLHGGDVASILSVVKRFGGGLPFAFAIEIARGACAGLHHAHEYQGPAGAPFGLVHRNISPQNLFVTFDGAVKLLDCGFVKPVTPRPEPPTAPGARRDPATYVSPEQAAGELLDRRSDVFSLSAVLWEMTVGEPPPLPRAARDARRAIAKAIVGPIVGQWSGNEVPRPSARTPGYPPALERIVMRGLSRDRGARYQTAAEMQVDLEAVARTTSQVTSPRELAVFMAEVFPGRLKAWQDSERRTTAPHAIPPRPLMLLPSGPTATAAVSRPDLEVPPVPAPARASARRARWIGASIGFAVLVLAIVVPRGSRSQDLQPPAVSGSASPAAPDHLRGEDPHWFEIDDYLVNIHGRGLEGDRLDDLMVARMVKRPVRPGARTWFVDTNGRQIDSDQFWRTRVAAPADLKFGAFALCHAHRHERRAGRPSNRNASRSGRWMLGRITAVSRLEDGFVSVANVECEVAGVRVPIE